MSGDLLKFKYFESFHCLSTDHNIHANFRLETNKKLSRDQKFNVEKYISTLVDYLNGGI